MLERGVHIADCAPPVETGQIMENLAAAISQLTQVLAKSSLTKCVTRTFADLVTEYLAVHPDCGDERTLLLLSKSDFGDKMLDDDFVKHYDRWFIRFCNSPTRQGDRPSIATVHNYKAWTRAVIRFGVDRKLIPEDPVGDYGINARANPRRQIGITAGELGHLLEVAEEADSPLLPWLRWATKNPIRFHSDVPKLERKNLNHENRFVKFRQKKVESRLFQFCYLIENDDWMMRYWSDLPDSCPWLFPYRRYGRLLQMGNPKKHLTWLIKRAGVEDRGVCFHTFRHIGMTYMVKTYGPWNVERLGIATSETVRHYYHESVDDEINAIRSGIKFQPVNLKVA